MSSSFEAQLTGLHARSEVLIELTREYDRNRVPFAKVEDQLQNETRELVNLQESLGCEYQTDGALGWKDQLRPLVESISGLAETTRYSRWFDTNTFYKKPIVNGKIELAKFDSSNFIKSNLLSKSRKGKVTLPGPYTLAELSENKHYSTQLELEQAFARVLHEIVLKLSAVGVKLFQLSEPSLVYWPYREKPPTKDEIRKAIDSIRSVVEGVQAEFVVNTFFGDAVPVFSSLQSLPVKAIGVDLYETDWQALPQERSEVGLLLGIVDSEESGVETPKWIFDTAFKVREKLNPSCLILGPNTDLKFVTREIADGKISSLGKAAKQLEGGYS
jgi:5-methyltetrahydropteroyltriglutamate--homocysteine methyltransferase